MKIALKLKITYKKKENELLEDSFSVRYKIILHDIGVFARF